MSLSLQRTTIYHGSLSSVSHGWEITLRLGRLTLETTILWSAKP